MVASTLVLIEGIPESNARSPTLALACRPARVVEDRHVSRKASNAAKIRCHKWAKNFEHILKTKFSNYAKGEKFQIPRFHDLHGQGICNSDGDLWYH